MFDSRTCVNVTWVCDGVPDCEDGSDETHCICPEDKFQCSNCTRGAACDNATSIPDFQCVSNSEVRDFETYHCQNGNDEPEQRSDLPK